MIEKVKHKKLTERFGFQRKTSAFKNLPKVFSIGGYNFRKIPNDWIKEDRDGRFHFTKSQKAGGIWNLHYDVFGEGCSHYSIHMPYKITMELNRLSIIAKNLKQKYENYRIK